MTATAAAAPPKRPVFSISKGRKTQPIRLAIYAPEGIGKSTFASEAERPLVLDVEHGTGHLDIPGRVDSGIESWAGLLGLVTLVADGDPQFAEFRTLVIDTLDAIEPMIWAFVTSRDNLTSRTPIRNIEDYGYGKGYVVALEEWRKLLAQLERLRARGMHVILVAHTQIKTFKNPLGEDFDRYQMKLHQTAAGAIREWCDVVVFANFEQDAKRADKKDRAAKGYSTGARFIYTQRSAVYDAKTRYKLPEQMPLEAAAFWAALAAGQTGDPDHLRRQIEAVRAQLADKVIAAHVAEAVAAAQDNSASLSLILDRARARLRLQEDATTNESKEA